MIKNIPKFEGRSPDQIVREMVNYDSVGYVFRALSWLDYAKRTRNVCALHYAAHDTRQSIEHLFFETVVLSVGTKLDREEYKKCKGNSTNLHKIVNRLNPSYERLAAFTQVVLSTDPQAPSILTSDHKYLLKSMGTISTYLHWAGEPKEAVASEVWLTDGIKQVEEVALHIWEKKTKSNSGIMMPDGMAPEIRSLWERYSAGEMDLDAVRRTADIAHPILKMRGEA
jgi:hypothetical protein